MTQIDSSLPGTLRRRAREMEAEGFNATYCASLFRAADELEVRRRCADPESAEALAINLLADNRRLRNTLVEIHGQVRARKPAGWIDQVEQRAKGALGAVKEWGRGRRIIASEIGKGETRHQVEEKIHAALDEYFTPAVHPAAVAIAGADAFTVPGVGKHGADGDSRPHETDLDDDADRLTPAVDGNR